MRTLLYATGLFLVQLALTTATVLSQEALSTNPLVIAHRGSSGQAPENTLPAFQLAWEQGADGIEADFQLSKDGHVVCFHDKDTKRITGRRGLVRKSTLDELRQLDAGSWKGESYKGVTIPTIAEVLAAIPPGKKIFIEIKCGSEIIDPLLRELASGRLTREQVTIICFDAALLKSFKERAPQWQTGWLCSFRKKADGTFSPDAVEVMKTLRENKANALFASWGNTGNDLLERLRKAGIGHHVWTVNSPQLAVSCRARGVQSIITDVPQSVREALARVSREGQ